MIRCAGISSRWRPRSPESGRREEFMTTTVLTEMNASQKTAARSCRFCGAGLTRTLVDLGMSPLCETYPTSADCNRGEMFYPLHVYVCEQCFLAQLEEYESPESIFTEYAYFSSYSDSWLKHSRTYCEKMTARFGLHSGSFVVEVASNDGY